MPPEINLDSLVGSAIGGGVTLGTVATVIVFVARAAIAKAIEHAGATELLRLSGKLDQELADKRAAFERELEDKRAAFAREMETLRQGAARDLEQFKSELALGSEVRRQVAALQVKAYTELAELGEPLFRDAVNQFTNDEFTGAMSRLHQFPLRARGLSHLLPPEDYRHVWSYSAEVMKCLAEWHSDGSIEHYDRAGAAYEEFMTMLRRALGVVPKGDASDAGSPRPNSTQ